MKKRLITILSSVLFITILSSCTTKTKPVDTNSNEDLTQIEQTNNEFLSWNLIADSKTWDPQLNGTNDGGDLINNMFEGLTRDRGNGKIEMATAESYELSEDNKVYTFKLKKDAMWSDGKPVTAHDFVYSITRAADPATASDYSFIVTDFIVGAKDFFDGNGNREDVGVKALDDYTLEISLINPTSFFLELCSFYTYAPVRKDIVETYGEGWEKKPESFVGNGPFKLSEYIPGSHLTMVKNENYLDSDKVKLAGIKAYMIVEATTALNAYQSGEIAVNALIPADSIAGLLAEDPNINVRPNIATYYYSFNVDKEPTNNVNVRKALSLAIDRKAIVETVTKSGQIPATGFVPSVLKYSDGTNAGSMDLGISETANIEEAKKYLSEAGYPNGEGFPNIELTYNTNEGVKAISEAIQQMWKDNLNINVSLRNEEWSIFQDTKRSGNFTIARGGWIGDYSDPYTMLSLFNVDSGYNDPQWRYDEQPIQAPHDKILNPSNEEYTNLMRASLQNIGAKRDENLKKAEEILIKQEMVVLPVYWYSSVFIIDEAVVSDVKRTTKGQWWFGEAYLN